MEMGKIADWTINTLLSVRNPIQIPYVDENGVEKVLFLKKQENEVIYDIVSAHYKPLPNDIETKIEIIAALNVAMDKGIFYE